MRNRCVGKGPDPAARGSLGPPRFIMIEPSAAQAAFTAALKERKEDAAVATLLEP